ncbi:hypothetical protein [Hymenobacter baengnokdamensis]|uniref:hypothetical protein n=1 Tax=Hymenobacter baengnokdamensis TaxID=2615203 RepID=UPI001245C08F|nr:hypothetical protein [Hymenobacter baengnokdamensis]
MKISHRAAAVASAAGSLAAEPLLALASPGAGFDKAPRLSCCCRISELLPLVRQVHDAARAAQLATERPDVAA